MCCDNSGASAGYWKGMNFISLVNGECEHCGAETVDGCSTDICNYSPQLCQECGDSPCDGSC